MSVYMWSIDFLQIFQGNLVRKGQSLKQIDAGPIGY